MLIQGGTGDVTVEDAHLLAEHARRHGVDVRSSCTRRPPTTSRSSGRSCPRPPRPCSRPEPSPAPPAPPQASPARPAGPVDRGADQPGGRVVGAAAVVRDEPFLWRMLLEAAHAGDEVDGVEALKGMPELARYVNGWGGPRPRRDRQLARRAGRRGLAAAAGGRRRGLRLRGRQHPRAGDRRLPARTGQGIGGRC